MAKRFIETTIWQEDWFLRMPLDYKLLFIWVITNCDHAGIYKPNIDTYNHINNSHIKQSEALTFFNFEKQRIRVLNNGRWLLEDFYVFQYGKSINEANRLHVSILKIWGLNEVNKGSIRGLQDLTNDPTQGVKDKDKDSYIKYGKEFKNMEWTPEQIAKRNEWYGQG